MALRELTGTALAMLALAAAFWLSVLPASVPSLTHVTCFL